MATTDSYSRLHGMSVLLVPEKLSSYGVGHGQFVIIYGGVYESYDRIQSIGSFDSSLAVAVRINPTSGFVQRINTNIGDIYGKLFDAVGGNTLVLTDVAYSTVGESGPWTLMDVKATDPSYSWPGVGNQSGVSFQVPVEVQEEVSGNIWIRMRVDY